MYVIIEGIDTAGKSTQIDLLQHKYPNAIITKEPGATDVGSKIRELVLRSDIHSKVCEMLLFLADRAEHYTQIIKPNQNQLIISDRGLISGISYAMNDFEDIELLVQLNKLCLDGVLPDKVVLLTLSKEELSNRLSSKSHDKIEQRGIEYMMNIQSNMIKVLEYLAVEYIAIDANNKIENIHNQVQKFLNY